MEKTGSLLGFRMRRRLERRRGMLAMSNAPRAQLMRPLVEEQIDDWCRIQREKLAQQQAANNRDSQRAPQFRANSGSKRQGNRAQQRRHGGHQDGPETQQRGLEDGVVG